jgi:hypothetical protein
MALLFYGRHMKRIFVPLLAFLVTFFSLDSARSQEIVINEFLFAPASGEAEWIELWNCSSHSISLHGWKIMDATHNPVRIASEDVTLAPGEYIVLASSLPLAARWEQLTVRVLAVPGFPSLNNTGDEIILCDSSGVTIDSVRYEASWNAKKSASVERRRPNQPFTQSNAGPALHPDGGTPGSRNSLTPPDFDLSLDALTATATGFTVCVRNVGMRTPGTAEVICGCSSSAGNTETRSVTFQAPAPEDSILLDFEMVCEGVVSTLAFLLCDQDTNPANDTLRLELNPPIRKGDIQFNEIMAAPLPGKAEWVELLNRGPYPLRLDGCSLAGAPGSNGNRTLLALPRGLPLLPPDGYLLISSDSSVFVDWPDLRNETHCIAAILGRSSLGLGNAGDEILLLDADGGTIDSIEYSETWHHPLVSSVAGKSLELLHPALRAQGASAWTTCVHPSGGTPGRRNAAWTDAGITAIGQEQLRCAPNPFSPDGDGFEDHTIISWTLPASASLLRLRIYDAAGRCIRTVLNNDLAGRKGMTVWDGLDDEGRRARIGLYVVLAEALDAWTNTVAVAKAAVAIAARL